MEAIDLFRLHVHDVAITCPNNSPIVQVDPETSTASESAGILCADARVKVDLVTKDDTAENPSSIWTSISPKWRSSHEFVSIEEDAPDAPDIAEPKAKSKKKKGEPWKLAKFKSSRYCLQTTASLELDGSKAISLGLLWTHALRFTLVNVSPSDEEAEVYASAMVALDSLFHGDCLHEEVFEFQVKEQCDDIMKQSSLRISLTATERMNRMLLGSSMLTIQDLRLPQEEFPDRWVADLLPEGDLEKDAVQELQRELIEHPKEFEAVVELYPDVGCEQTVTLRLEMLCPPTSQDETKEDAELDKTKAEMAALQWYARLKNRVGICFFLMRKQAHALELPLQLKLNFKGDEKITVLQRPHFKYLLQESVPANMPRNKPSETQASPFSDTCQAESKMTANPSLSKDSPESVQERAMALRRHLTVSSDCCESKEPYVALDYDTCIRLAQECELRGEFKRAELFWLESGDLLAFAKTHLRQRNLEKAIGVLQLLQSQGGESEDKVASKLLSMVLFENGEIEEAFALENHAEHLRLAYQYSQTVIPENALTADDCIRLASAALDLKLQTVADLACRIANELQREPLIDEALLVSELLRAKLKSISSEPNACLKILQALKHDYYRIDWDSVSDELRLEYYVDVGLAFLEQGMHDSAKESFATALTILNVMSKPNAKLLQLVFYYLGTLGISCGNPRATRLMFLQAAKKEPLCRYAWVWLLMGIAELSINEFEDADVALMKASNLDNMNPTVWFYCAVLYAKVNLEHEARFALQNAMHLGLQATYLKHDPGVPQHLNTLSHSLRKDRVVQDLNKLFL